MILSSYATPAGEVSALDIGPSAYFYGVEF